MAITGLGTTKASHQFCGIKGQTPPTLITITSEFSKSCNAASFRCRGNTFPCCEGYGKFTALDTKDQRPNFSIVWSNVINYEHFHGFYHPGAHSEMFPTWWERLVLVSWAGSRQQEGITAADRTSEARWWEEPMPCFRSHCNSPLNSADVADHHTLQDNFLQLWSILCN